jgi:hypothetical protein
MKQLAAPSGVFVILMAVYLWTMAPGNFWIDSAAFTACNEILGLSHSPSFPLYTTLGRVIHLLYPGDPAAASNFYSALMAAAGGTVLYLILGLLLTPVKLSSGIKSLASASGALYAFMAIPLWQSAVRAEVYSLQILLSLIVVYLFLKTVKDKHPRRKIKLALAAVFLQGLAFANHSLLALTTFPLILSFPFFIRGWSLNSGLLKFSLAAVLVFCVAISFYLFLPIRSNQDPAINSGQPKTLATMIKAITRTGEDYLPAGPETTTNYTARAGKLAGFMFDQSGGLIILGILASIVVAIRQRKKAVLLLTGTIFIGLAVTIWAADFRMLNFDIVAYSALPLILLVMMGFHGLSHLAAKAAERVGPGRFVPLVFVLMVFFQFSGNLYACDLSGTAGPDRLAEIIIEEAPQNAILLLNEDNTVLPLWYHCLALDKRQDMVIISAGGLYRPSYRNELKILYPDVKYPGEFENYRINDLGRAVESFCELNKNERPIMVQFGIPGITAASLSPAGFLFRYDPGENTDSCEPQYPSPDLIEYIAEGATDLLTRDFAARTAFNYGVYFDRIGQSEPAWRFFEYAIETDDENPDYLLRLGVAFLKAGQQDKAILLLKEAVKTGEGCPDAEEILKRIADRKYGKR